MPNTHFPKAYHSLTFARRKRPIFIVRDAERDGARLRFLLVVGGGGGAHVGRGDGERRLEAVPHDGEAAAAAAARRRGRGGGGGALVVDVQVLRRCGQCCRDLSHFGQGGERVTSATCTHCK